MGQALVAGGQGSGHQRKDRSGRPAQIVAAGLGIAARLTSASGIRLLIRQFVAGAAPAAGRLLQHAQFQQLGDVAQRGVGRALGDGCPLAAGELALEAVEQTVEQLHLPLVQRRACPALPETRLDQHGIQCGLRAGDGAPERTEEPRQPAGDVERAFLRALQHVVVVLALALDLRRQAVEALRATIGAGQEQIAHGAGDAPVAVVEGVQRHEPEVRQPGLDEHRLAGFLIGPREEARRLGGQHLGGRRLEVDLAPPHRAGDDLHRPGGIVAPLAHGELVHARIPGREQRRVPAEQALGGQRGGGVGRGVEHHLDHAFDVPIDRSYCADVHAQTPGDGRAHGFDVQHFAFDFAGLDYVLGQGGETSLIAQRQPHVGQAAQQHALGAADLGQRPGQRGQVVAPVGPVVGLPDVVLFSAVHAEIKHPIRRKGKSFSASYAANVAANRRIRQPRSSPQDVPIFSARRFEIPLAGTKSSFDRHA